MFCRSVTFWERIQLNVVRKCRGARSKEHSNVICYITEQLTQAILPFFCFLKEPSGSWHFLFAMKCEPCANTRSSMSITFIESKAFTQKQTTPSCSLTIMHNDRPLCRPGCIDNFSLNFIITHLLCTNEKKWKQVHKVSFVLGTKLVTETQWHVQGYHSPDSRKIRLF